MFARVSEAAAKKHSDIVSAKVDTEAEQALATAVQITSIPTLMEFGTPDPHRSPQKENPMGYALSTTVDEPFEQTLEATRAALAEQGFGVLTEIDLKATLKTKLDVDTAPQVILGACRPPLAHAALLAEPSIGLLLPCNVVVRVIDGDRTLVEAMDPP